MPFARRQDAEPVYIERENAKELLACLRDLDDAAKIAVVDRLTVVVARGLGEDNSPLTEGKAVMDRFERLFDTLITVEEPPPVPYEASELAAFCDAAVITLRDRATHYDPEDSPEDNLSMQKYYASIADDQLRLGEMFARGEMLDAINFHDGMDTADRDWLFIGGAEEERYWVTKEIVAEKALAA